MHTGTTTLYRAYDSKDRLLYVGICTGVFLRLGQHADSAGWAAFATRITLERYPTRKEAEQAELAAIRREDPVWNMNGRPTERYMRWMAAYPDVDPDTVDLAALVARTGELVKRSREEASS